MTASIGSISRCLNHNDYLDEFTYGGDAYKCIKDCYSVDASAIHRINDKIQELGEAVSLTNKLFVAVAQTSVIGLCNLNNTPGQSMPRLVSPIKPYQIATVPGSDIREQSLFLIQTGDKHLQKYLIGATTPCMKNLTSNNNTGHYSTPILITTGSMLITVSLFRLESVI